MNSYLLLSFLLNLLLLQLSSAHPQQLSHCSNIYDCNETFISPIANRINNLRKKLTALDQPYASRNQLKISRTLNADCTSIRDCDPGLVCVSGNPIGKCSKPEGIRGISHLVVNLIQEDYTEDSTSSPHSPSQGGVLLAARAIALVHIAAHDAYAIASGAFAPKIDKGTVPELSAQNLDNTTLEVQAIYAMQVAGLTVAKELYPASAKIIDAIQSSLIKDAMPVVADFGETIGRNWMSKRQRDGSSGAQVDSRFQNGTLHHQPDPNYPIIIGREQTNFGRRWINVKPFMLSSASKQAKLKPFPSINSKEYRDNLKEVIELGQCNNRKLPNGIPLEDIGVFWGYDGASKIGTPPRLYLQVALAVKELESLPVSSQLRILTAVSMSMMDAGLSAWHWKFEYDLWRPTIGVRNDPESPVADWNPIGIPLSNRIRESAPASDRFAECVGVNPNFPAYPSGHASFGTAAFKTIGKILGKSLNDIQITFTSDELNGVTIDGVTGKKRKVLTQKISLAEAVKQNKESRLYLGVHWRFDSDAGDIVGTQVADIVAKQFEL